jgi:hypothetical protein
MLAMTNQDFTFRGIAHTPKWASRNRMKIKPQSTQRIAESTEIAFGNIISVFSVV